MSISLSLIGCSKEMQLKSSEICNLKIDSNNLFNNFKPYQSLKNDVTKTVLLLIALRIIKVINIVYPFTCLDLNYLDHIVVETALTWRMVLYLIGVYKQDISVAAIYTLDIKSLKLWKTLLYILLPLQTYIILKVLLLATDGFFIINTMFLSKPIGVLLGLSAFKLYCNKLFIAAINYWKESTDEKSANSKFSSICSPNQQLILVEYIDDKNKIQNLIKSSNYTPASHCASTSNPDYPTSIDNAKLYFNNRAVLFVPTLLNQLKAKIAYIVIKATYDSIF